MKRKLTTILFADAQGYSSMMAANEAATLERLNRYRTIMRNLFERHDGRQINTWGDAVIAEFSSVVEAVRCAVEIQDSFSTENESQPADSQMWFRIGINLGDVIVDKDDIYGDGVNVAQRLQSMAEPGGILVSGTVHSLVHKQLALAFDFAGDQKVTEGVDRVPSYRVRMAGRNSPSVVDAPPFDQPPQGASSAPTPFATTASRLDLAWGWLGAQSFLVRFSAGMIGFFFLLNLLSGLGNPWFVYPCAPFAVIILLRARKQQKNRPP